MRLPATGRTTVWTTAISVSALVPHAAPVALGLAVAKESFDLLHARMYRTTVLSYIRAAGAGMYLSVDSSGPAPGVILHTTRSSAGLPDGEGGAVPVSAENEPSRSAADPEPGEFCIKHRAEWLRYALAHARNMQDAEDAVSHVGVKILQHHAKTGRICPGKYDPEAWSKTVIANYIKDLWRRDLRQLKYQGKLLSLPGDFVEDLADEMLARQVLPFIKSLSSDDHQIAEMRYVEGLSPSVIAEKLGRNVVTVRTSLWRTSRKIRRQVGIAATPQVIIPRRETTS